MNSFSFLHLQSALLFPFSCWNDKIETQSHWWVAVTHMWKWTDCFMNFVDTGRHTLNIEGSYIPSTRWNGCILEVSLGLEEFLPPFLMTVWGPTDRPEAIHLRIRVRVRVSAGRSRGRCQKCLGMVGQSCSSQHVFCTGSLISTTTDWWASCPVKQLRWAATVIDPHTACGTSKVVRMFGRHLICARTTVLPARNVGLSVHSSVNMAKVNVTSSGIFWILSIFPTSLAGSLTKLRRLGMSGQAQ